MVLLQLMQRLTLAIIPVFFIVFAAQAQEPPSEPAAEETTSEPVAEAPATDPPADPAPPEPSADAPSQASPTPADAPQSETDSQAAQPQEPVAPESETTAPTEEVSLPNVPAEPSACDRAIDACTATCTRFDEGDARLAACTNFCQTRLNQCAVPDAEGVGAVLSAARPELQVAPLQTKKEMLKALELNAAMLAAIRAGNMKGIRRLVETDGLNPTYVSTYEYNATTKQFEGRIVRLRLADVFNDGNFLRGDALGLDRILQLFIDLGMDVKATLPVKVTSALGKPAEVERTAWGPSLKTMESARDREARLRAFELSMQQGLVPNDDFTEWLFGELPQVCGRDRSKFSIQVFDLMIKYLGQSLQEPLWREGERGPETVADVLDRSFGAAQAKTTFDRQQSAIQDQVWENCTSLSRRINRYLMQGQ